MAKETGSDPVLLLGDRPAPGDRPAHRADDAAVDANEERASQHAARNLSTSVVAIEFTLISVMVGVILVPLVESATVLLREQQVQYWPYIVGGLVLILYLWSSVISHSLTFI